MKETIALMTKLDLLQKVAAHKGLKLLDGSLEAYSEPIKEYALNEELLAALARGNIKRQNRPDCKNKVFTLVDENPQTNTPGYSPSNSWNFKRLEDDKRIFNLRTTLYVGLGISTEKRGVVLYPRVRGSFISADDQLPNFRFFRVLVEMDANVPIVAKELAASDGTIVVTWTDIGLGGVRRLAELFTEFAAGNKKVACLSRNDGEVFNPNPNQYYQQPGDVLFVPEPMQPKIFELWRAQLKEYRSHLVV